MQGRYLEHQALKALGGRERISMVTAFRPKCPFVRDETILTGSRPISNLEELYTDYTEYRLGVLEERFRAKLQEEKRKKAEAASSELLNATPKFDISEIKRFLTEQKLFLESTITELIDVDNDEGYNAA